MAVKFETVQAGELLYDCHKTRVANRSTMGTWRVKVVSIDPEKQTAMCSWNGNPTELYTKRRLEKLRRKPYAPRKNRGC